MFKKYFLFSLLDFSGINPEVYGYTENITKRVEVYLLSFFVLMLIQSISIMIFFRKVCEWSIPIMLLCTFIFIILNLIVVNNILKKIIISLFFKIYFILYALFFVLHRALVF